MKGRSKLAKYLRGKKLTQEQFAEIAGVPGPQMSLWLSGKRKPGLESAVKIEDATGGFVNHRDWIDEPRSRRAAPRSAARTVRSDKHPQD